MLLHNERQLIQGVFQRLSRKRIVLNQIQLLHQILLAQNGQRLTRCRRRQHGDVAASCVADTADSVVRGDRLDSLSASGRAHDDGQVILVKDLERVSKDSGRAIAVKLYPTGAAADGHLRSSQCAVHLPRLQFHCQFIGNHRQFE